jgi:hypothetical protein
VSDFNPDLTTRLKVAVKKRVIPREQWKSRAKDLSAICLAAGAGLVGLWMAFPEDLKTHIPAQVVAWTVGGLNVIGWFGKFVTGTPRE